jgi:hypothetical protein
MMLIVDLLRLLPFFLDADDLPDDGGGGLETEYASVVSKLMSSSDMNEEERGGKGCDVI